MSRVIPQKKINYLSQLVNYLEEYEHVLVVGVDNVGSNQMQMIRHALRNRAVVLMGKNTLVKKGMRMNIQKMPRLQPLIDVLKGNKGLVFTNEDPGAIREILLANKVEAPARVGTISPVKVVVPAGVTGLEPTKTSFFQALSIPTKITRGTVEILNDYTLLEVGDKVGNSEAALLQMLGIKPFYYGLTLQYVLAGSAFFKASVLELTDAVLAEKFNNGLKNIAAFSLQTGFVSEPAIPHLVYNAFKDLAAVAIEANLEMERAKDIKNFLADPSAFAVAAAPAAGGAAAAAPKAEEKPKSESDEDMGMDLFG